MKLRNAALVVAAVTAAASFAWYVGSRTADDTGAGSVDERVDSFGRPGGAEGADLPATGAVIAPRSEDSLAFGAELAGPPDGAPAAQAEPAGIDRKIVRTASLDLRVESVTRAFEDVGRIATGAGGFIASSSIGRQRIGADEVQVGSVTIRVPNQRYEDVMARLRGLAVEVVSEQSESSDVTAEYTDLQSRLRNLEATERQYLAFLERAQDLDDILVITDRINQVRGEIEQVQGRIKLLNDLSDLATITTHLTPAAAETQPRDRGAEGVPDPLAAAREAWERSLETLALIASGALVVVVYSWWILPPVLAGALGARAWLRRRTRPSVAPDAPVA